MAVFYSGGKGKRPGGLGVKARPGGLGLGSGRAKPGGGRGAGRGLVDTIDVGNQTLAGIHKELQKQTGLLQQMANASGQGLGVQQQQTGLAQQSTRVQTQGLGVQRQLQNIQGQGLDIARRQNVPSLGAVAAGSARTAGLYAGVVTATATGLAASAGPDTYATVTGSLQLLSLTVARDLIPGLRAFAGGLQSLARWWNNLPRPVHEGIQGLGQGIGSAAGGAHPVGGNGWVGFGAGIVTSIPIVGPMLNLAGALNRPPGQEQLQQAREELTRLQLQRLQPGGATEATQTRIRELERIVQQGQGPMLSTGNWASQSRSLESLHDAIQSDAMRGNLDQEILAATVENGMTLHQIAIDTERMRAFFNHMNVTPP